MSSQVGRNSSGQAELAQSIHVGSPSGDGQLHGLVVRGGDRAMETGLGSQRYSATVEKQAEAGRDRQMKGGEACKGGRAGGALSSGGPQEHHSHSEEDEEGKRFRKKGVPS